MLKSEMQHQFWITKKTVQRTFGSKEDEHVISSDAELDAKVDVFKSISTTSVKLSKIIDQYQERLCLLSQEECLLGRFLKETGRRSKTASQNMTNAGKAVSYCGHQRMVIRVPLLRLQHEIDVFRGRAIADMQNTITNMEKERTEYRAALEWMKSASTELDPDTGRGLDKFRRAQSHVRNAKQNFDSLAMDSIQKVDLLAAARCNMFSHVLVSYMAELNQFAQKTNITFEAISKVVEHKTKYDFCILKGLTQHRENDQKVDDAKPPTFDGDQSLFFAEDYEDNNKSNVSDNKSKEIAMKSSDNLVEICNNTEYILDLYGKKHNESTEENKESEIVDGKSTEKLSEAFNTEVSASHEPTSILATHERHIKEVNNRRFESSPVTGNNKIKSRNLKRNNPWIELFADLDPLANLEAFDSKLSGSCKNIQQT